jgi:hypothetical protein
MGCVVSAIWGVVKRLPFTLVSLAGLIATGLVTRTHQEQLSPPWLEQMGFAPNDLWLWQIERMFTAPLVTFGGNVFWAALLQISLFVGLAEWLTGTRRAMLTFWGGHLSTLTILSNLIVWPLHSRGVAEAEAVALARDVGPSAGFFACLGLASGRLPRRWLTGGLVMALLMVLLLLPPRKGESRAVKLSADLAHAIAFPLGWLSAGSGGGKQ